MEEEENKEILNEIHPEVKKHKKRKKRSIKKLFLQLLTLNQKKK
jgi:hypothetical protein